MNKLLCIGLLGLSFAVTAQQKTPTETYSDLKKAGKLTGNEPIFQNPNATKSLHISGLSNSLSKNGLQYNQTMATSSACNCWIPRDTSFHIVPFDGSGSIGTPPTYANDDGSTNGITLPFNFCLYGNNVGISTNQMYINNNGNITFGAPYVTFSAVAFPSATYTMVAPFWGDVQTTNPGSGFVYYQLTPTHLIIQWDSVTCYQTGTAVANSNLHNTFQLIITDGIDPILPNGSNISFCYGDMQWTTGDASSPSPSHSGFSNNSSNGSPATVGVNKGNGTNYIQVSRFGDSTNTFTNPAGMPQSGIQWLANKSFYFNSCGSSSNFPPLSLNGDSLCDTTLLVVGSAFQRKVSFTGPEPTQTVTITCSSIDLGTSLSVIDSTTGVQASLTYRVNSAFLIPGYYHTTVTATDNGAPTLSTIQTHVIKVVDSNITTSISKINTSKMVAYPNPTNGIFTIETNNASKQTLQIFDINGKLVLSQMINSKANVDASNLMDGVYNLSIISNEGVINKRLVIVK